MLKTPEHCPLLPIFRDPHDTYTEARHVYCSASMLYSRFIVMLRWWCYSTWQTSEADVLWLTCSVTMTPLLPFFSSLDCSARWHTSMPLTGLIHTSITSGTHSIPAFTMQLYVFFSLPLSFFLFSFLFFFLPFLPIDLLYSAHVMIDWLTPLIWASVLHVMANCHRVWPSTHWIYLLLRLMFVYTKLCLRLHYS